MKTPYILRTNKIRILEYRIENQYAIFNRSDGLHIVGILRKQKFRWMPYEHVLRNERNVAMGHFVTNGDEFALHAILLYRIPNVKRV